MKCHLFGLFIWMNDDPVTGTVLSLSNIDSPRKDFQEYLVGDVVDVRFKGFGLHKGVVGMIGDEASKNEMGAIINDARFVDLVNKFCGSESVSEENTLQKKGKRKAMVPLKEKTGKKPKVNLVLAAKTQQEFDLTGGSSSPPCDDVNNNAMVPLKEKTGKTPKVNLIMEAEKKRNEEMTLLSRGSSSPPCEDIHNPVDTLSVLKTKDSNANLHQRVNWLEVQLRQAWQCIYELQQNVGWLRQYQQMETSRPMPSSPMPSSPMTSSSPMPSSPMPSRPMPSRPMSETARPGKETTESPHNGSAGSGEMFEQFTTVAETLDEESVLNNYTKEQLNSVVVSGKDYSKVVKRLFRQLYSSKEMAGRSLTGMAANSKLAPRPPLEDQSKVKVIYELVKRRWPFVTEAMVNARISEVLKPSRN